MKRIVIDLDSTLAFRSAGQSYEEASPNLPVIARLAEYQRDGFEIVIHTSRNMRTHGGNVGKINVHTLPLILQWLERHAVPFDEVIVGKPWCGEEGFYVDDRAIRPSEFAALDLSQVNKLLET